MTDHYKILGVPPSASRAEVRSAYLQLAKMLHPDTGTHSDLEWFKTINASYGVLKDKAKRAEYDGVRKLHAKPCRRCDGVGVVYLPKGITGRVSKTCGLCWGHGVEQSGE